MKKWIGLLSIVILLFLILHSTPQLAVRTNVFVMGYPAAALKSGLADDKFEKYVDKDTSSEQNVKIYTLTEPPVEKATQGQLRNYRVKKIGFLHFAEYYGEG
ncbi:hypothetical protein ACQ0QQ_03840 [Lysinibacillus sphaericus]